MKVKKGEWGFSILPKGEALQEGPQGGLKRAA